jgi:cystathionine gamma-synthase
MRDIHGYEEKSPATMQHVPSAYPRFVVHPFTVRLAQHFSASDPSLAGRSLWLAASGRMADLLADFLRREVVAKQGDAQQIRRFTSGPLDGVSHPADAKELSVAAKTFLQNVGGFLSSRESEDHLVRLGLISAPHDEPFFAGDADAEIRRVLRRAFPECGGDDLLLANCGMNAIYAAFAASAAIQRPRGKTVWLQLGWLYRDTIAILQKFTDSPSDYVYVRDPLDYTVELLLEKNAVGGFQLSRKAPAGLGRDTWLGGAGEQMKQLRIASAASAGRR